MKVLLIIPVFNEQATIREVVSEVFRHVDIDSLIIDDGSTDNSIKFIKTLNHPRITILHHDNNEGYGKCLMEGFQFAIRNKYEAVITMDCDFQHEPEHLPEFIEEIKKVDIVSGSRYLKESNGDYIIPPKERVLINKIITDRINKLTDYQLTDAFCGYKAYRTEALIKLSLTEKGYGLPLQLWIQAYRQKLRVKEIPVNRIYLHTERSFGPELDDPERRLRYYNTIIDKELENVS